jgi:hypothetical protein
MVRPPDGIINVRVGGKQYRGAFYFRGDELVVSAFGLRESSVDIAVFGSDRGRVANGFAELLLIDMVRQSMIERGMDPNF